MADEPRLRDVQCLSPAGLHRMAYAEWGEPRNPKVLICVHGLSRVGRDFDAFARVMASDYRVVCPDVVGRGRSDWLQDPMLYQIPTYVADMVNLIARLDVAEVHWFGTSMGGLIGMGLASLPKTPISRMVLNDVGPVISAVSLARIGEYLGQPVRFPDLDAATRYIRTISAPFGPHSDAQWRFLTEVVLSRDGDGYRLHYDPAIAKPFAAAAAANTSGADTELWSMYDAIRCPTLAVRGERSDLLTRQTHEAMATRGPRATLATIAGVGHAPTFMHDDQIRIARNFLLGIENDHG